MNKTIIATIIKGVLAIIMCVFFFAAHASTLTIQNTFSPGTQARASEVNANFDAVESAVNDNDARLTINTSDISSLQSLVATLQETIANLQGTINDLENRIVAIEENSVLALDGKLSFNNDSYGRPRALFSGVNVQVVNNAAQTDANGTGNIILGYDAVRDPSNADICSDGSYSNQTDCELAGKVWAKNHKSGSHNLVIGAGNNYSQTGGAVIGYENTINRDFVSVVGGKRNIASGLYAGVYGGISNTASGLNAVVSGGVSNIASGFYSNVSGGIDNTASGNDSSVSGGDGNTASGIASSVSGGRSNTANGNQSSVSGGSNNVASGDQSSVSGGGTNSASASGSSVSGGNGRAASGLYNWAAGSLFENF